jgi:hypothetical protein
MPMPPAEFTAYVDKEIALNAGLARKAGLEPQ